MTPTRRVLSLLLLPLLAGLCGADPVDFKSPGDKFAVKFPTKPEEKDQKTQVGPMKMYQSFSGTSGYMVMVMDNPDLAKATPETIETALDKGRDSISAKAKLLSEKKIKLDDKYPGRELVVEMSNKTGYLRLRMYLAETTLYGVMVVGQTKDALEAKDSTEFLDSFRLGKK